MIVRLLVVVGALLGASGAWALEPKDCTLHVPFDGAYDAAQSRGAGEAAVKGEIRFVPGIRGQGVLVGAPDTGLSYETRGNLNLAAGSVSVWVKPETWDDTDAAMRFFFGVSEANGKVPQDGGTFIWLYRFFAQSTYFLVWDSRGYPTLAAADPKQFPALFKRGEWVHLVGTWNGDEIRLFVNGKLQSTARVSTPRLLRSLGETFTVGDPNAAKAADTVLDELRLFDRALTPPEVEALHQFRLEAEPAHLEVSVTRLPTTQKVRVDVNAIGHRPGETAGLSAQPALSREGEEQVIRKASIPHFSIQHQVAELSTKGLPPGDYRVVITLRERGRALETREAGFSLKPPPAWLGSKVGRSARVPAPWTPLVVRGKGAGATVECWGPRRYRVGEALFPTGLVTCSRQVLSGPITLSGVVNGSPLKPAGAKTAWGKRTPARVDLRATGGSEAVALSTRSFVDYDGLLWTTLRLSGKGPLKVSRLTLDVPLRPEAATLMQTGLSWQDAGRVRRWQHRVLADSQVWLGNEEGGVQWTIPSARNWRSADRGRQIQVLPEAGRVVLRLNLVDKPSTFAGSVDYQFGMQLTPVRPFPKGWRTWRITPLPGTPGTRFSPFYTEGWAVGTSYPIPRPDWEKICNEATERGDVATLYLQPFSTWAGMPDYPDFASEWRTRYHGVPPAPDTQAPPTSLIGCCPRPASWGDYFVDTFFRLTQGEYRKMGWGAIYFDVTSTPTCDNADHGCGYVDEHGVRQGEQRFLEHRDVQRRFYTALQERWPGKRLFNHESGQLDMTQLAFCHGMVDGEHLTQLLSADGFNYHKMLTLERMRAEYMGRNFGFVPIFLPEFQRAGAGSAEVTRRFMLTEEPPEVMHLVGLLFLHDILPWPAYSSVTPYHHLWAVQDAFGWGDEVELLPYWKNRHLVQLSPANPNVVCSLYRRPGKLMAVVMNNTDSEREVSVQLDLAKLGLSRPASALDAWKAASFPSLRYVANPQNPNGFTTEPAQVTGTEERLPVTNGRLALKVGARSFRVLTVE